MPKSYSIEDFVQTRNTGSSPNQNSPTTSRAVSIDDFVKTRNAAPAQGEQKPKDGFVTSVLKDAAETLVVKPVDRATELIGRSGVLGDTIKRGYEADAEAGRNRQIFGIDVDQQRGFNDGGAKQIGGEALKSLSYLYSGGAGAPAVRGAVSAVAPGATRETFKQGLRTAATQGAKVGAVGGGAFGAGEEMTQRDSTLGSVLKQGAIGAGAGAVAGGAIGTAIPFTGKLISPAERASRRSNEVREALDRATISRGKNPQRDAEIGTRVLKEMDIEDIKTNADLANRADEYIQNIVKNLDEVLETDTTRRTLPQLRAKDRFNYVDEALNQLEKEYRKTNNVQGIRLSESLRRKALNDGLTVKEINDIARLHGRDLNAFNLNGELSSGLNKRAAENTRRGLKETVRSNFGNKIAAEADRAISDFSRIKKIAEDRARAVQKFEALRVRPTLLQKAGSLIEQAINIATLGTSRSLLSLAARNAAGGPSKLNVLDLEKKLAKDLKIIQDAVKNGSSDETIIQKLQEFIRNNGEKPVLLLEAPKPTTLFATQAGKVTPVAQEAADIAAVEAGKAKIPKTGPLYRQKVKEIQNRLEPYLTADEMQIIKMGPKGKPKDTGLPTAEGAPDVYVNPKTQEEFLQNKLERYLSPEEMEIIDWGPKKKKTPRSLTDIFIE
jgi:hypothetical protein